MDSLYFRAHGKLLLTAEYVVLDGATALALPTHPGQRLEARVVSTSRSLHWQSFDADGSIWFEAVFSLPELDMITHQDAAVAETLRSILLAARDQNPLFLADGRGWAVRTQLEFPRHWGLGSSSTLIYSIAQWSDTDPYRLLAATMGGSGYDIACAGGGGPLLFTLRGGKPAVKHIIFQPPFADQLYLVYLGRKQNSREGIARYRESQVDKTALAERFSALTSRFAAAGDLPTFQALIREHEQWIAGLLNLPRAKERYFADFRGEVKSLGAWGGDFVLAAAEDNTAETSAYFRKKGFEVVLRYSDLVM